mmetsp:Transcript_43373/g.87740  ORF Transcript_43373/g.87740 Transcript_43373/m.87740 type:complete len:512 (-) Transcript_43373:234-1769(-)
MAALAGEDAADAFVATLLAVLEANGSVSNSMELAEAHGVDHQEVVVRAIKTLEAALYVTSTLASFEMYELSPEGLAMVAAGKTPEMALFLELTEEGVSTKDLEAKLGKEAVKIGLGPNMKNKWARNDKATSMVARIVDPASVQDSVLLQMQGLQKSPRGDGLNKKDIDALAKRKLVVKKKCTFFSLAKGPSYACEFKKQEAELTSEMMASGAWQAADFKAYNFDAEGAATGGGYFHPLLKVRAEFRRILMSMGFQEMETSKWVESSFWNFDSLFQPQSHPARDAHDTFFIKEPAAMNSCPPDYYERVKQQHEVGGHGSIGYRTVFEAKEASKNLLRTHTTAISAQMLYKLAEDYKATGVFTPKKFFSVDRVFRNETMDKTHLCEFHQVEGLVADYNLSLKDLIGQIKTFFEAIGITQLRFKPAFNPYTEPSMEVFGYHPDLGKWTEIGNSGMFRPEMLAPMGLPEGVRVIAWGLSLERPTMIKYRISNIRDLFGHQVDVNQTKRAPIARFP